MNIVEAYVFSIPIATAVIIYGWVKAARAGNHPLSAVSTVLGLGFMFLTMICVVTYIMYAQGGMRPIGVFFMVAGSALGGLLGGHYGTIRKLFSRVDTLTQKPEPPQPAPQTNIDVEAKIEELLKNNRR